MGAEEILEEDAREDWISRGFAMKDFSVKKMTGSSLGPLLGAVYSCSPSFAAIWDLEEKEEVKRAKKLKVIQHKHRPLKEDIKHVVTKVTSELHNMSENVRETIRQFEPVILRDRRWLREHIATIFRMDEECTKYKRMKVTNHAEYMRTAKQEHTKQVERHGRIEHKAPLLRRLREMKEEADKRARAQATQELETKWKYWHDQEMEEKERYVSLTQKQNDDHIAYKRKMNMQYWKAKDKVARKEAEAVTTELAHARAMSAQRVELMDYQSNLKALEEKVERLRVQKANTMDDRKIILDKKAGVVRGLHQAKATHRDILTTLAGPPRREPGDVERRHIHSLLKQQADFSSELKELSIRERLLTERLSGCSEEEHALVEQIEKVSDAVRAKEAVVAEMDKMQNDLPMVIGRSIAHGFQGFDGASSSNETKHGNPMKNLLPQETLTAITQRTKLELLKAAAIPAFQLYEEARYLGLESWKLSKQKMVDEAELELTVHRLAKIKDTLTKQQSLNQRSDVINALEKFHVMEKRQVCHRSIHNVGMGFFRSYPSMAASQKLGLMVSGTFKEDETAADAIPNAVHAGKHVLSEYVKMLRVQSQQGNHRCASLLEELIKVESSHAELWDSKVLHGHAQRFPRLTYAIHLREAIQHEISKAIQHDINKRRVAFVDAAQPNASTSIVEVDVDDDDSQLEREKQAEEQKLLEAEVEAKKIQSTSKSLLEIEQDYVAINIREDAQFEKVQAMDLAPRRLMQNVNHHNVTFELTLKTLKANYIQQTVATRMEFLKKTWTRKNQRRLDKRKAERDQRKRKYDQSNQQVLEMSKKERFEKETAAKKDQAAAEGVAMAAALQKALQIPNFNLSVAPEPPCAHRELKHWGAKYDKGMRCKHCGKEMSHVVDDPDAARGADPALDRDVEKHRLFEASFRFENAAHLQRVERERLRLEKEAREMQLAEVQSYDSTHMKAIDDLNFRHVIERNVDDRDETRNAMDRHEAAYRDELSFFARVNQFRYRLRILQDLRGAAYKERLVEVERQTTQDFVVVIQVEQERARQLLKDRQAAIDAYNASAKHLQE
ncbi:hypothetical protein DYB32_006528 [Aphanomyces invadans]|uniref:Uncharacterized protein n=1 Tax=Aphanomyces invadans TaxID=157072 RepID=A0A3R7A6S4_9STRA|nr:hypothetical protein DYB32_006528 [Aphanomyces invadans]